MASWAYSTGTYAYVCDGASPGSSVLSDGHAIYTPGLSENRAGVSAYYAKDRQGNLWTIDGSGNSALAYEDNSAFGGITASGGAAARRSSSAGGTAARVTRTRAWS